MLSAVFTLFLVVISLTFRDFSASLFNMKFHILTKFVSVACAIASAEGSLRGRRLTCSDPVEMETLDVAIGCTALGESLIVPGGTFAGDAKLRITQTMNLDCADGEDCIVDGLDDHACIHIGINTEKISSTVSNMKFANANTGLYFVSAN